MDNADALYTLIKSDSKYLEIFYQQTISDFPKLDLDNVLMAQWENILQCDLVPLVVKKLEKLDPSLFNMIIGLSSSRNIKWTNLRQTVDWLVCLFTEKTNGIKKISDCPLILPNIVELLTIVTLDLEENIRIGNLLIPEILEFLIKIKTPPSKSFFTPNGPFVLIKSDGIKTIGNLSYRCVKNQDLVAELGGMGILLDHCNIQDEFPFVKECSIFAIRNLTDGHIKNQEIISKLEPLGLTESSKSLLDEIIR